MKKITGFLFGLALAFALAFGFSGKAEASCVAWDPLHITCTFYQPSPPPGAGNGLCALGTNPGPTEIFVYTQPSFQGVCIKIVKNSQDSDMAAHDWYKPYSNVPSSIKMGSDPNLQGYIYQGANATGSGWALSPGVGYLNITGLQIHTILSR